MVATTYGRNATIGDYQLRVQGTTCPTLNFVGARMSGGWASWDCESSRRPSRYVDFYTFEVAPGQTTRHVTIDLTSSTDPYLFLIAGSDPSGTQYLHYNDDAGGSRGLNSRISEPLVPGTYTIAATTWGSYTTGGYILEVQGHR